jgi:hypothetical protein
VIPSEATRWYAIQGAVDDGLVDDVLEVPVADEHAASVIAIKHAPITRDGPRLEPRAAPRRLVRCADVSVMRFSRRRAVDPMRA